MMTDRDVAALIDISAVQAYHGKKEIDELVSLARKYGFIAVHVLPCWLPYLKGELEGTEILAGGPVGYPSGGHTTPIKVAEAEQLKADGIQEMDLMINVGKLKSGEYDFVLEDIKAVVDTAKPLPVKVILEVHYLTEDEIKRGCELCIEGGADFVKTATGWASSGATLDTVRLITNFVGDSIKVKAAGGVRGLDTFIEMYRLGVERFGINARASVDLLEEVRKQPGGKVDLRVLS